MFYALTATHPTNRAKLIPQERCVLSLDPILTIEAFGLPPRGVFQRSEPSSLCRTLVLAASVLSIILSLAYLISHIIQHAFHDNIY